jgi:hypothetical protein
MPQSAQWATAMLVLRMHVGTSWAAAPSHIRITHKFEKEPKLVCLIESKV